jgi:hypothetical protein
MKIKISKSHISLLTSGIICLNLLKNKIFKIKIWSLTSENIIFYVSLIKNDKQKKEKKLTFLNHLTYFYLHSENDRYIHTGSLSRVPNIA